MHIMCNMRDEMHAQHAVKLVAVIVYLAAYICSYRARAARITMVTVTGCFAACFVFLGNFLSASPM